MSGLTDKDTVEQPADTVIDAVMRPFARTSVRYRVSAAVLAVVLAVAIAAWIYQLRRGMAVAGYTDSSFWAIYIADVVAFIGVSYGGAVVSAILMLAGASWRAPLVRMAEGVALVTVAVGAAFIIPHLGRPDRLLDMVTHANVASPVFWDMMAIITYTFATLVFFVLPLIPDTAALLVERSDELGRFRRSLYRFLSRGWVGSVEQRRVLHSAMIVVAILIIPLAVAVHSVLAWAFALVSRPGWHESIWAPYFVIAALYSGVALVIVVTAAFRRGYRLEAFIDRKHFVRMGYIMVALGAVYVYLTFADLLPSAYVGETGPSEIIYGMLFGPVALWFWLFLVAGTVLPIVIVALPWTRTIPGIVVASVLVLIAMWIKRLIMVVESSAYDRLSNSFGAFFEFTWVSIAITVGGVAAIALLLMLLFRAVPLLSIAEIRESSAEGHTAPQAEREAPTPQPPDGRPRGSVAAGAGALLLVVLAVGALGVARAQSAEAAPRSPMPAATGPQPKVEIVASEDGAVNTVSAVVSLNGVPVEGALVSFYESTAMFAPGDNQVPLGSIETGADGRAQVTYAAATTGPREVSAVYYPDVMGDPVVGTTTLDVQEAVQAYQPTPPKLLATAGQVLAMTLLGLVALVFVILIVQVVRVRRACRPESASPAESPVAT